MPHLFEPLTLRDITLKNRIMMSPMCQYCAGSDGLPTDWHHVHYATRAIGGTGLIMVEAAAVESRGRITLRDLGIWEDRQGEALGRIAETIKGYGTTAGLQIHHTGRKAWRETSGVGPEQPIGPSAIPLSEGYAVPHELSVEEIGQVLEAFRRGARRAREAGFQVLEIHGAHGYLISAFLSPLSNSREDDYGGSPQKRMRFLHEVVRAVRQEWPESLPLFVRLSCSDFHPEGNSISDIVEVARTLPQHGVDLLDCSGGGVVETTYPIGPGYMVPFAHRIKRDAGIPTGAVGLISSPEMAEEIVSNQRADLVLLGRELLRNPYWPLQAAKELKVELDWPEQYRRARR
jgi:NADPH2 dehydrogenase